MPALDLGGLLVTIGFVIAALSLIPLDKHLERRRARRRNQARPWRNL